MSRKSFLTAKDGDMEISSKFPMRAEVFPIMLFYAVNEVVQQFLNSPHKKAKKR
jgi:hypothetical protein